MEHVYTLIIALLFLLAISDLIVGVSNDAVNFLNSAIGSKAAPIKLIMIIAALGILFGVTFSDGMMEVARKGIFHPELFYFSEVIVIFIAVMLTDIILLDTFNSFGMPTSTTVSIVFALLGAAVSVSLIKIHNDPNHNLGEYINSAKALAIISAILISVVIAFSVGAVVQFISRLVFSFKYKRSIKYFGSIWGGIAITSITYFILIKGIKGASFISEDSINYILNNTWKIIFFSFIGWTIIFQLLMSLFKLNILKLIVIVGTFGLAMAFAGNDLVNFIGVPLAGFESYKSFIHNPGADPHTFLMVGLTGKVHTQTFLLLIAGTIMAITLWFSKKSRSVIKTAVDLSRQEESGDEKFGSFVLARLMVRWNSSFIKRLKFIIPKPVKNFVNKQFTLPEKDKTVDLKDAPAFDMIRASVNLVVASILIALGTSLKLPLSTTYVTFMVAMGTSLADKAWGKESAVYRITGVIAVIGGWFLTALIAFSIAFLIALYIYYTQIIGLIILLIVVAFMIFNTYRRFKKKQKEKTNEVNTVDIIEDENIINVSTNNITENLIDIKNLYSDLFQNLISGNRKKLKINIKDVKTINEKVKYIKDHVYKVINKLKFDPVDTSHYYVQVLDYLRETAHCLTYMAKPAYDYLDNEHPKLIDVQKEELNHIRVEVIKFYNELINIIENDYFKDVDRILNIKEELVEEIEKYRKEQIRRVKKELVGTRNSMLFLGLLHETKNLLLHSANLLKSQRDFIIYRQNR